MDNFIGSTFSRKNFLKFSFAGALSIVAPGSGAMLFAQNQKDKPPPIDKELVKDFVGKSHKDFEGVKDLLLHEPGLINCAWDWGGGDFETGLEAAGHVGDREIAEYLIANGARMNVFCAAMLGQLELVKQVLTAYPAMKSSKGPHGLQLIHHAKKGGDEALAVLEYLEGIGAS